jgi:hypothetical protein
MSGPAGWPAGIEPIGIDDLRRLGINRDNELFWDGRRVEVRRRLVLTRFQTVVTAIVTVCAILGGLGGFVTGLNNASVFLCGRGLHWLGCPPPGR